MHCEQTRAGPQRCSSHSRTIVWPYLSAFGARGKGGKLSACDFFFWPQLHCRQACEPYTTESAVAAPEISRQYIVRPMHQLLNRRKPPLFSAAACRRARALCPGALTSHQLWSCSTGARLSSITFPVAKAVLELLDKGAVLVKCCHRRHRLCKLFASRLRMTFSNVFYAKVAGLCFVVCNPRRAMAFRVYCCS
jgi:hypothetical protein